MNPIDTDPRVTADMMSEGKVKLALLTNTIKKAISLLLGDDFGFVVLIRHKTEAKTMLMFGDVDSQEEMSEIITEGYERHKSSEINRYSEEELCVQEQQH